MDSKSLTVKEVEIKIVQFRDIGKSDEDIYNELKDLYNGNYPLRMIIKGVITEIQKQKFKKINTLLIILLGLVVFLRSYKLFYLYTSSVNLNAMAFCIFLIFLNFYFIFKLLKYWVRIYRIIGMIFTAFLVQSFFSTTDLIDKVFQIILSGSITFLSFYLAEKLYSSKIEGNGKDKL